MLKFWIITIQIFLKKTILSNEIVRIEDTAPKIVFFSVHGKKSNF